MLETIKANLRAFTGTDWLVLVACAAVFGLLLDNLGGALIGAVVGYLLANHLRRERPKRQGDGPLIPPDRR